MTDRQPPLRHTALAPGLGVVPVRSPTLPPATHTNAWTLGQDRVVVVDPAGVEPDQQRGLRDALGSRRVQAILLTHHHVDHVASAADLVARTGAPVWAHAETAARIELPVQRLLAEGDLVEVDDGPWTVLHTPGHAPGHICLHRPADGLVVAGDMVAGVGTILLDPPEGVLSEYLHSLDRLRALKPRCLLPAHGPAIADAVARLTEYIDHRHQRTRQVVAGLRSGPSSALGLVPGIYPDLATLYVPIAARQVLCHLQWLMATGAAAPLDADGAGVQDRWSLSPHR